MPLDLGSLQSGGLDLGSLETGGTPAAQSLGWQYQSPQPVVSKPAQAHLVQSSPVPFVPSVPAPPLDGWIQEIQRPPRGLKRLFHPPYLSGPTTIVGVVPPPPILTTFDLGALQSCGLDLGALETGVCPGNLWDSIITSELLWGNVTTGIAAHATITSELIWIAPEWEIDSSFAQFWTLVQTSNLLRWRSTITSQLLWYVPAGTPSQCIGGSGSPTGGSSTTTTGGNGNYCF